MGTSIVVPNGYKCAFESPLEPNVNAMLNLVADSAYKMQEIFIHENTKHPFLWMASIGAVSDRSLENYIITPELLYMLDSDRIGYFSDLYRRHELGDRPKPDMVRWFFRKYYNLIPYTIDAFLLRFMVDEGYLPRNLRAVAIDHSMIDRFTSAIHDWANNGENFT